MRVLVISLAMLALGGCRQAEPQAENESVAAVQAGPVKGVDRSHKGQSFPDVKFLQDHGAGTGETSFEPFLGTPTVVNFWASWCVPCIKELPTLHALSKSGKLDLAVLPLNQDGGPQASVRAFMAKHGVEELGDYQDPKMNVAGALGVEVLPTTILFDAEGKEVWRYVGELDWTGPEAAKLIAEAEAGSKA